jgi:hypothetical protein
MSYSLLFLLLAISGNILQDFYLELVEDNRRITPPDYLELALRPVPGSGKDIAAKNQVLSGSCFSYSIKIAGDLYERNFVLIIC